MTVRVGVIGVGNIGTAHARNLARRVSGAQVTAVFDADSHRAGAVAVEVGAVPVSSADELIDRADVDAVVIASPDHLHAAQALECIAAGKPTLCEKPLAPDLPDALAVMAAEVTTGRRLVTLGFMRRFDPGYADLKHRLASGEFGEPLLTRNIHRNKEVGPTQTTAMSLTNSAVHEIDINRWLLGTEYASAQVISGRPGPHGASGLKDPFLVFLRTVDDVIVEIELFGNSRYGYEVRCEVVASEGSLVLGDGSFISATQGGHRGHAVHAQWLSRFDDAYRLELQAWIDSVLAGAATGPSVWDGYAATAVAHACIAAADSGETIPVCLIEKPCLY
ncbi:MAG: Gfo/Idh/MocA family oxidoreductase [bacterium]|nr:Gfo/Idh/MocA family oxidoreductase [bacterium]